jgi:medium-chain acyl-[acyl-carrier-protein] hydrolase
MSDALFHRAADCAPFLNSIPSRTRSIRLYCFSYAGGNPLAFLRWQPAVEPDVEVYPVHLPGHGTRLCEPAPTSCGNLIDAALPQITSVDSRPFAFFGHSLGGLLAFEAARYCARRGLPGPACLFISGCSAPRNLPRENLHLLGDDALIDALREFNGTPPEALANRELIEIFLPVIRADLMLADSYVYEFDGILHTYQRVNGQQGPRC